MLTYYLFLFASYFIGSIPSGYLLTKAFNNTDIRTQGSGNIGFSNVWRTQKKIVAILTIIADISKTILPLLISTHYFSEYNLLLCGLLVFFGHIFSIFLKFKGGKGIAVIFAILLYLNIYIGLICLVSWLLIIKITKHAFVASIVTFGSAISYLSFIDQENIIYYLVINMMIIFSHQKNIKEFLTSLSKKKSI